MSQPFCRPLSFHDALTGKRVRLTRLERGTALCALTNDCPPRLCAPQPILGYWHRPDALHVYVPGRMAAQLRTAVQEGRTRDEVLLEPLPAGIQEIDLTDCRAEFRLLRHPASLSTQQTAA